MRLKHFIIGILAAACLLWLPWPAAEIPPASESGVPFVWNQDALWDSLAVSFQRHRETGCSSVDRISERSLGTLDAMLDSLEATRLLPSSPLLTRLETTLFEVAPLVAACPENLDRYVGRYQRMRQLVKRQSQDWDLSLRGSRERLYRLLYGGRAAVEEVVLQHPDRIPALLNGTDEPTASPMAVVQGVAIASGDILVSRGGYPTSALISRGSDYPGNFSHIALVHVDESTGAVSAIESHIEIGVAVATVDEYLRDKKLRILVLRPRSDLLQIVADPLLPHKAAMRALARARTEHVPYDFEMDYHDPSKLFCSEVASSVYRNLGVELWMGISTISADGLRRWLAAFGVRHFETQEPSDLEYDPQLVVVAEWRDPATLLDDHIDNAVIDVMLEGAEEGDRLEYSWFDLGPARLLKAYSAVLNVVGRVGPVPEGMSASSALRNRAFSARHARLAAAVRESTESFRDENGYTPPYWELVRLARQHNAAEQNPSLAIHRDPP